MSEARPERVLVVDDNRDWADSLSRLLRDEGYSVHTAYDGREAIQSAAQSQPQVVLLDLEMPKINGFDAASIFARHPSSTRPVLVAITAWSEESHKAKAKLVFAKNPPQAFFSRLCA